MTSSPYAPPTRPRRLLQSNPCSAQYGKGQGIRHIHGTQGGIARNPIITPTRVRARYVREGQCFNPNCDRTELENGQWRKDGKGNQLCNACGLYSKTHQGAFRPKKVCVRPYTTKRDRLETLQTGDCDLLKTAPPRKSGRPALRSQSRKTSVASETVDPCNAVLSKVAEVLVPEEVPCANVAEKLLVNAGDEELEAINSLMLLGEPPIDAVPLQLPPIHALLHTRPSWLYNLPPILPRPIAPPAGFLHDTATPMATSSLQSLGSHPKIRLDAVSSSSACSALITPVDYCHDLVGSASWPYAQDRPFSATSTSAFSSGWVDRRGDEWEDANTEAKGVWRGHHLRED